MISCLFISFNFTYSSKYIFIFFASKFTLSWSGDALIKIGAVSSFSPPVGLPLLAHLAKETTIIIAIHIKNLVQNNNLFI